MHNLCARDVKVFELGLRDGCLAPCWHGFMDLTCVRLPQQGSMLRFCKLQPHASLPLQIAIA